jgi:hypothetical protein
MATLDNDDLKAVKSLVDVALDEKLDEKLEDKLSYLPTKDEFYEQTLKILKKLDDLEESMDIVSARQSEHSDKTEALENIHPQRIHSISS